MLTQLAIVFGIPLAICGIHDVVRWLRKVNRHINP
jgi:hypothetical protein